MDEFIQTNVEVAHVKGCVSKEDISRISDLIGEVGSRLSQRRDRLTAEEGLPRRKSGLAADQWVSGQALGRAALWLLRNEALNREGNFHAETASNSSPRFP